MTTLLAAAVHMSLIGSLRILPFAVYMAMSPAVPRGRALLAVGVYLFFPVAAWALGHFASVLWIAIGLGYFAIWSLAVNWLSTLLADGHVTRGGAFLILALVFLFVPAVVLPGIARTFLVVGFELLLSAYSYCAETSRPRAARASLRDCMFFLFVNPALVYSDRGVPVPPVSRDHRGLWRVAAGGAVMFLNAALLRPAIQHVRAEHHANGSAAALLSIAFYGLALLLSVYAAQSGLASIRIGVVRLAGWVVPECYHYPLLAKDPMDFWRRWNRYMRVWLEAYVFFPTARGIARRTRNPAGQLVAAVGTLIACGLLHDLFHFVAQLSVASSFTRLFLAAAGLLAVWRLAAGLCKALGRRLAMFRSAEFDALSRVSARVATGAALIAAAVTWG